MGFMSKSVLPMFSSKSFIVFSLTFRSLIHFLSLIFVNLITMCLSLFCLGFILYGTLCTSWTWVAVSFPMLGRFSTIMSSNIFLGTFSLSSPSGTPIMLMLVDLVSQRSLRLSSFLFVLLSLFYSAAVNCTICLLGPYLFFCLSYSAIDSF